MSIAITSIIFLPLAAILLACNMAQRAGGE